MNYKILFASIFVLTAAVLMTLGCIGAASSKQISAPASDSLNNSRIDNKSVAVADNALPSADDVFNGEKIVKTEAEWRKQLTKEQFYVLREQGTERPFTGKYTDNHEEGDYYCAACHLKLFASKNKFDSGTGWISFYQPVVEKNVTVAKDESYGMSRDEVVCSRCNSHLGHVFDDGPEPTGLRYCMNSAALTFEKKK